MLPSPRDPEVVRAMRAHRAALLRDELAQMHQMTMSWLRVERGLESQIEALTFRIQEIRAAGETVTANRLYQMERYQSLLAQARAEIEGYNASAAGLIQAKQGEYATLGITHSSEAINMVGRGQISLTFADRLPVAALENMVGLMGNGTPLGIYLRQNALPGALDGLTGALLDAIAQGRSPYETAKLMQDGLAGGLQSALNVARTEQLRVYREAALQNYSQSGLVRGYKRLSARDDRTCPACLMADDGRIWGIEKGFYSHVNCRCTTVPVVEGMPVVSWQTGPAWYLGQGADTQLAILGPGRFDAWQDGQFDLADLVTETHDQDWGGALIPTTLEALLGG